MTGIAAIFSPGPVCEDRLARMAGALAVRRHDDLSTLAKGSMGLVACVWHTTPEALETGQPLANEDASLAVALDGYLTNWEELRRDLLARGAILRDRSDAELVLRAYETWGEDCARHLDGEFAFVVADWRRRRIYAARDHLGLKPLHYYRDGDRLLIASDIAAIIAALDTKPAPNHEFLASLIAGDLFVAGQTAWTGLESLAHAHWLACDAEKLVTARYYQLPTQVTIRYRSDEEHAEHHRSMLFEAVRRSSRSHAPVAIEVSGGLDSSAIFASAHHLHRQGLLLAPDIAGYTLAGEPGTRAFELPYARAVAEHLGRRVTEVPMFQPGPEWYAAQARRNHDLPPPSNGAMSFDLERRAADDGARVLVSGLGGDEWLGGSPAYYREFAARGEFGRFLRSLGEDIAVGGWRRTLPIAARMGLSGVLPHTLRKTLGKLLGGKEFDAAADAPWLKPGLRERVNALAMQYRASLPDDPDVRLRMIRFAYPWALYARSTMQRQPASNGLELRFPLLSRPFVEFSAATPEYARMRRGINKYTHRLAMRGLLPDVVTERQTKAAFQSAAFNRELRRHIAGEGAEALGPLVDHDLLLGAFSHKAESAVDERLTWQIYGTYAAACFLEHARKRAGSAPD